MTFEAADRLRSRIIRDITRLERGLQDDALDPLHAFRLYRQLGELWEQIACEEVIGEW